MSTAQEIVDRLNAYGAQRRDAEGPNIWGDVIEKLPTSGLVDDEGNTTMFALTDGTVTGWDDESQWAVATRG